MGRRRPKKTVSPLPDSTTVDTSSATPTSQDASSRWATEVIDDKVSEKSKSTLLKEGVKEPETLNLTEDRKLWVDILKDNRNPAKGRSMKFIAPKIVEGG